MPYEWLPPDDNEYRLHAWPHRSLTQRGFVWFLGTTAALIALPLLAILGSPVLWGAAAVPGRELGRSGSRCARTAATATSSRNLS